MFTPLNQKKATIRLSVSPVHRYYNRYKEFQKLALKIDEESD